MVTNSLSAQVRGITNKEMVCILGGLQHFLISVVNKCKSCLTELCFKMLLDNMNTENMEDGSLLKEMISQETF